MECITTLPVETPWAAHIHNHLVSFLTKGGVSAYIYSTAVSLLTHHPAPFRLTLSSSGECKVPLLSEVCVQTTDEGLVPLLINCWPSASGSESYVNIEYESTTDFDLQNVAIAIPLPALAASTKVNQVSHSGTNTGLALQLLLPQTAMHCQQLTLMLKSTAVHSFWQSLGSACRTASPSMLICSAVEVCACSVLPGQISIKSTFIDIPHG